MSGGGPSWANAGSAIKAPPYSIVAATNEVSAVESFMLALVPAAGGRVTRPNRILIAREPAGAAMLRRRNVKPVVRQVEREAAARPERVPDVAVIDQVPEGNCRLVDLSLGRPHQRHRRHAAARRAARIESG